MSSIYSYIRVLGIARALTAFLLIIQALSASAAIAVVDAPQAAAFTGTSYPIGTGPSITVSAGAKVLVVLLGDKDSAVNYAPPTSLTWNGQTLIRAVTVSNGLANYRGASIYYLFNPTPGSGAVSDVGSTAGATFWWMKSFTLSGVDTNVAPLTGSAFDVATATSLTFDVAGGPANGTAAVVAHWASNSSGSNTTGITFTGTGGTATAAFETGTNSSSTGIGLGYISGLSAGTDTFAATLSGTGNKCVFAAAVFAPAAAGGTAPAITTQPSSQSVAPGASASFTVVAAGTAPLTYQWSKGSTAISGATSATYTIAAAATTDAGSYTVAVTNSAGSVTSSAAVLTVSSASSAPTITTQPAAQSVATGASATFTVAASGTAPLTYQWSKGSTAISGATSATYTIASAATTDAGSYTVTVTNSVGSVTSTAATLTVTTGGGTGPTKIMNLAIRSNAGTGAQTLIVGVAITGGSKALLVRGVGPSLGSTVTGALADPQLNFYSGSTVSLSNDDWGTATNAAQITTTNAAMGALPFTTGSKDSAILSTVNAGLYTALVTGANGTTGVALAEIYDTEAISSASKIAAISARTQVGTGSNVVTATLVLTGGVSKTLLVRCVGPALASYGITGALPEPKLGVYSSTNAVLASNTGWSTATNASQLATTAAQVGAFALASTSADSAALVTLQPGVYTVQISSAGTSTGIGLIEIYDVQ